ncbi:class I adenylate-forming enzyme family protein [Marinobacter salarius]|uniref:class I adenylate-forming enzyme family protein n=1 Tax=Marinobacter salarius TaxID=1420917 RepID=UPI0032EF2927
MNTATEIIGSGIGHSPLIRRVGDLPAQAARRYGQRRALICGDARATFAEIDAWSASIAGYLAGGGIVPGERVIVYGANSIGWVVSYYAALRAGAIVVPVNKLLTPAEMVYIAGHCGARLILGSLASLAPLTNESALAALPQLAWDGEDGTFEATIDAAHAAPDLRDGEGVLDTPASICYTSGTTGRPKGATLTHRNILTNVLLTATLHGKTEHDVMISALPCPHVYGNVVTQSVFVTGAQLVLFPAFDATEVLDAIETHRATVFEGVPTMYYYLLNEALEQRDLSSLRLLTVGGQTMPVVRMQEVQQRFGLPLVELWGMTELAGLGTTHSHLVANAGLAPLGSIGTSLPGVQARITSLDDPKREAPAGDPGELNIRGPIVMQGYWDNEAATNETIDAAGWLATGDIATLEPDGTIRVVDRKKDMILTAGYNIYPAEVEGALCAHEAVAMAAVVGEPDADKGEIPVAHVVCKADITLSEEALISHCRTHLAAYKVPRRIVFTDDLPKTSSGKILRRALRREP